MKALALKIAWALLALAAGWAYITLFVHRGEALNSGCILVAALCSYAIGYRFYSKWIAARVLMLNDRRATPCEVHDDGKDFVRTHKWIAFGQHFAAISGPGPLLGPVLAAQFGYLPGTLWILIGVTLGGAVQDFVILFASLRRDGKSLGQMVKEELNSTAGALALVAILAILLILLAVLGLVVVKALAESPWGLFTVGATVPIAMLLGLYLRFFRVGKVIEASALGGGLLLFAVWGGKLASQNTALAAVLTCPAYPLAWGIITYGLAASVLPVWLLLAPRGYLSTFLKLGTIFALALGILLVLPDLRLPPVTKFVDGSGPIIAGKVFPFCFITIACGAVSGFHALIASGTTPKILTRESYARSVGYGAMCLESLVAILALIAACSLAPGLYFGMNVPSQGQDAQAKAADLIQRLAAAGTDFVVSAPAMEALASQVKEKTLFNRTGGAATLAAGMAGIFSKVTQGRWLDLWYHFAIMFEALFILTTLDAGTRAGRYLLQDLLGSLWKPLGETRKLGPNLIASFLMVGGWGYFLIQGVRDPLGGVNSLWPLFGISNQLLAGIALCLGTTIILKMQILPRRRPALALLTFVPLVWLVAVTSTASMEKIFSHDPRIGFVAAAHNFREDELRIASRESLAAQPESRATPNPSGSGERRQEETNGRAQEIKRLKSLERNNILDAIVAGVLLILVWFILILSGRQWWLLLAGRRAADLRESESVWLPDSALAEARPVRLAGWMPLALALIREVSGQGALERAQSRGMHTSVEAHRVDQPKGASYAEASERPYRGFNRCC